MTEASEPMRLIVERVAAIRRYKGLTQSQLAEAMQQLGVPWQRIIVAKIEGGRRDFLTVEELLALCIALEISPVDLLVPRELKPDQPYHVAPPPEKQRFGCGPVARERSSTDSTETKKNPSPRSPAGFGSSSRQASPATPPIGCRQTEVSGWPSGIETSMKYQETGTRHDHQDQNSLSGHHQDHPRGRHRCLPVDHPVGTRVDHLGIRREIQQCFTFGTLAETRAKQAELRDAKKRGVLVKRDNITFDELCERWLDSRHDIREVSRLGYTHLLKAPRAQFGAEKVQDLCRADIENLIGVLERRKRSHRTITYTRGTISQVLDYGIASGLLSVNVAAGVKVPRKQHSQARVDTTPKMSGLRAGG
jgi:transcriptional regulator with XRE-family HTH domain